MLKDKVNAYYDQKVREEKQQFRKQEQQNRNLIMKKLSDIGYTMKEITDIMEIDIQEVAIVLKTSRNPSHVLALHKDNPFNEYIS